MNNSTTKDLLINGSPSLHNFPLKIGEIREDQFRLANKLKDLILLHSLIFEKNSINPMFTVSFSGIQEEGHYSINYSQIYMLEQFTGLDVSHGSIIACNFDICKQNLNQIFEGRPGLSIGGVICPGIDEYSIGVLRNQKIDCFVMAGKILSKNREGFQTLLELNKELIPKLELIQGYTFSGLAMEEVKKFF